MTVSLLLTFLIIGVGIFLFVKDYFSIDTTSILIMSLFIVTGILTPEDGFSGFNHPATLTLGCMFVVSAAVFKTGVIDGVSRRISFYARRHFVFALIIFCVFSALLSSIVNDSAVVALMIPLVMKVSRETGVSSAKLLIPVAFSALMGGTCTLVGTSANILVSGYAEKSGLPPFTMFEFTLPALCLVVLGLGYLFLIGPFLLPKRETQDPSLTETALEYVTEIQLIKSGFDCNKKVYNTALIKEFGAQIMEIRREGNPIFSFDRDFKLEENDRLRVLLTPEALSNLKSSNGYRLLGEDEFSQGTSNHKIFETIIPFGSPLGGNSLKSIQFRNQYHASVLAVHHRSEVITENLSETTLKEGDILLIYATRNELNFLLSKKLVLLLSEYRPNRVNYRKAIPALLIAAGVIIVAGLNIAPILLCAMIGALLLVTTSTIKPQEAYEAIEWKVIFMMAGVLSMGTALEKTGGSALIAQVIFDTMGGLDPTLTLGLIFGVGFLSTNVLSSKATAALLSPIVIQLAQKLQVSERPFLIAVMFACSFTFMTPVSHPANTLVYAPGNYQFQDFLKIGTPLNILIWVAATIIIPMFFPF